MKDPFEYAHEREDEVIWMSQNTNELETSPLIRMEIEKAVKDKKYALYPHQEGVLGLKEAILQDLGLEEGYDVLVTNGGIEATYILTRAMLSEADNVIGSDPSFMPIHHQVELCDSEMKEIFVYEDPYRMTVDEVNEEVDEDTKFILLIDPLNPLGSSYPRDAVKGICDIAEDHDIWVIDDITYRDFAYEHTMTDEFIPEKTFFVYSFSKNCGFAGMRLGALIMREEISEDIKNWRTNPLSANVLAQVGAKVALKTKDQWMGDMVEQSRKNQQIIKESVEKIDGLHLPVYPSSTNMFAIDMEETGIDPTELQEVLLKDYNIFIRAGSYVSARAGQNFIRVSFTVPELQVEHFAEVLPDVIEDMR